MNLEVTPYPHTEEQNQVVHVPHEGYKKNGELSPTSAKIGEQHSSLT